MRSYINSWILLSLAVIPCQLLAATNPVTWTVTPSSGFPATHVGDQSTIKYTLTNHLPFSVQMTAGEVVTGGNFTVRDECKGVSVAKGGTCDIYVGFNPAGVEISTFQLVYGYNKNRIPTTVFTATGQAAGAVLAGSIIGLPNSFFQNDTPNFIVKYVNKGNTALTACTDGGSPLSLTGSATSTATLSSVVDGCNGQPIEMGNSCKVTGKIIDTSTTGNLTLAGNLSCTAGSGSVAANPQATSTVESSSGCTVHAYVTLALPATTYKYSDNIVQFQFENECGTAAPIAPSITSNGISATVTTSTSSSLTTCTNSLAAHSSCIVTANVRSLDTGTLSVTGATLSGGQTARAITSASVNQPGYHHNVTFVNQCPYPVWIGIVNAGTGKVDPVTPSTPDDYKLSIQSPGARPATKTVTFNTEYLGGFWGRTQCIPCQTVNLPSCATANTFVCQTGNCATSGYQSGKCTAAGALAPFTGLEMNFFDTAQTDKSYDGVYDVTMIGGVNVPVMFKGFGPTRTVVTPPPYNNSAFQCNSSGSPVQSYSTTGLGSCPWTFSIPGASPNRLPAKALNFVTNDATPSTYDLSSDDNCGCAVGKICGLAMGIGGADNNIYFPACGSLLGYLTVNSLCTSVFDMTHVAGSVSPKTFYHCTNNLNTQLGKPGRYLASNTVEDLYSCVFDKNNPSYLNSCFLADDNPGHDDKCCGAKNWSFTAQDFFANISNPDWLSPGSSLIPSPYQSILWLTLGCPTAYSYPFDDHFGSFYCKQSAPGTNVKMDYEVVYCPGGLEGTLPPG